jgi:TRAP-type transport system periplasmic protein
VIVNKARFERLTPAQRTALQEAAQQTIRAQVLATGQQEKEVAAQIKAKGVEILPFGDMETVQRKTKAVSDEYESKHPLIKEFAEYMRRQPR